MAQSKYTIYSVLIINIIALFLSVENIIKYPYNFIKMFISYTVNFNNY